MPKIVLQAGHINIKSNSIVALRGSTGAPGEQEFTQDIVNRIKNLLTPLGVEVVIADANANDDPKITGVDWDLFLPIHFDADTYWLDSKDHSKGTKSGGFVDFADPSTDDATKESQRIAKIISDNYFSTLGIENHPERSNANTRFFYMWKYLTAKTPCVIIECGVGARKPMDYETLKNKRDLVADAIARGIATALGVPYASSAEVKKLLEQIKKLTGDVTGLKTQVEKLTTDFKNQAKDNEARIKEMKTKLNDFIKNL